MNLGVCPLPNTGLITNLLKTLTFHPLTSKIQEDILFTLLLILAVGLSVISGSIKMVSLSLSALLAWLYPVLLVLVAVGCAAYFFVRYLRR
jgi:Ca2+/Na+ antiporter